MRNLIFVLLTLIVISSCQSKKSNSPWSLMLNLPDKTEVITQLPENLSEAFSTEKTIDGFKIQFTLDPKGSYTVFKANVTNDNPGAKCYLSLRYNYTNEKPWNFDGEVQKSDVYRQSPHDCEAWVMGDNFAKQAMPIIAIKKDSVFSIAINGSPAFYDNFTTQNYNLEEKFAEISGGDNGKGTQPDTAKSSTGKDLHQGRVMAHYPVVSNDKPFVFEGILFQSKAKDVNGLRKSANSMVAEHFGQGKYHDYFGSLAFTTAYMNLRRNETGKSKYWVVPSVEYGAVQYCRDAFWISTMLSPELDAQCMKSELDSANHNAESPLLVVLWAYRSKAKGMEVDMAKVQQVIDVIEKHVKNGFYHSFDKNDGRLDFQYWGDLMVFDKNDVIAYNQGFYALALKAAEKMELQIKTSPELALANYKGMFNAKEGFFPISKMKNILGPDPVLPDLMAQILFNEAILDKNQVLQHYKKVMGGKTPFGYKVYCKPDGGYLPIEAFSIHGYTSIVQKQKIKEGEYQHGGSWLLYDMLFLLDAYMQGIDGAKEELIWRICVEFKNGNTTHEYIDTKTGVAYKPNMGWNISIYSFAKKLVEDGKMDNAMFDAIDKISNNE